MNAKTLAMTKVALLVLAVTAAITPARADLTMDGAGATFPYPIYSKWFSEYNKIHPDVKINYQSIGSGGGIRQLTNETVFFGATDGPMTQEQLLAAPGRVLHFPTVLGAVVPVYNLPGVDAELRFSGTTLPGTDITFVHRADGSGTSYIFVDFLAKVSAEFRQKVGVATSVNWPTGLGGKGNEGVAGLVKQTPGSIGYVELIYALQNSIAYGAVKNLDGQFVKASLAGVKAAAVAAAAQMPADFRVSITNAPGKETYPISSFTWLLLYEKPKDKAKSKAMLDFMKWALTEGQKYASDLGYAPLPEGVVALEMTALQKIK